MHFVFLLGAGGYLMASEGDLVDTKGWLTCCGILTGAGGVEDEWWVTYMSSSGLFSSF
jgi:hypothetical protein